MSQNSLPATAPKRPLLIILLTIVAVAACAAAGYSWWLLQQRDGGAQTAIEKEKPPAPPVFMPLDTFTVNLVTPDNDPDRVLYIGLTLRLPEVRSRQLNDFLPEVRSRLLMLLSRQEAGHLANEQGKQQLVAQIKETLSAPLVKGQPKQVVSDVLFTAFILR